MTKKPTDDRSVGEVNRTVFAGTDVASFYLYHPDDLRHRLTSPLAWSGYHFARQPEFAAGRLVAFDTGSDGSYVLRVTDGPLTGREKLAGCWDFRYVVRHSRVYLDGGYALPSDDYVDDSRDHPDQWIELPNGKYRVTVNAIEWYSEPGALGADGHAADGALPCYVIQFAPVDDLETIAVSRTPPRLEMSRDREPKPSPSFADDDTFDEEKVELADSYVVLVNEKVAPIPGFHVSMEVSSDFERAVFGTKGNILLPDRIEQLVVASSDQAPCVGVLAKPSGASKSGDEPWRMSFHAKRLVTVTAFERRQPWLKATVRALERPESTVSADRLSALKRAFADYASSNQAYRTSIEHPDFEAERVASMNSATGVTHVLIHHVQMPLATRLGLLPLSNAERVERLAAMLRKGG